jgi:hypothetical protein
MLASPTEASMVVNMPWSRYMMIMYAVNVLITIRSVYRVIEYMQGPQGVLQGHEAYLYAFDSSLMLICSVIFNVFHPTQIIVGGKKDKMEGSHEMLNASQQNPVV